MDEQEYCKVREELEVSSLAADSANEFPESYTVDEVLGLADRLNDASAEADKIMREDFAKLSKPEQECLIELLSGRSDQTRQGWRDYLRVTNADSFGSDS